MKHTFTLIKFFEHCIWRSRLFVVFAVIASIFAGILMIAVGSVAVFWDFSHFSEILSPNISLEETQKTLTIHAISAMDTFLIATVLFIFGIGLYDLFIRKITVTETGDSSELVVTGLEQLKEKLVKVILIVLVVAFFKYAISFSYTTVIDLLYLAIAILLISAATFLGRIKAKH